jgi:hypothetical protein
MYSGALRGVNLTSADFVHMPVNMQKFDKLLIFQQGPSQPTTGTIPSNEELKADWL